MPPGGHGRRLLSGVALICDDTVAGGHLRREVCAGGRRVVGVTPD